MSQNTGSGPGPVETGLDSAAGTLRWRSIVIGTASLLVLATHAYLGSYSRFMADDYCSAAEAEKFGILRAAWYWYRTWNGRYAANTLDAFFGILGPNFTPMVTGLVIVAWIAALATSIRLVGPIRGGQRPWLFSIAMAGAILVSTLALAPNVAQSLYWGQGMRSVIPPLILMTLYGALFLWFRGRGWSTRGKAMGMILSFLLTFGAGGFSETYTAVQLATICIALAVVISSSGSLPKENAILFLAAGLLGAILSFITVVKAPGNSARAAFFPPPPALPELLRIALDSYRMFFSRIFDSPARILSLISVFCLGGWAGMVVDLRLGGWQRLLLVIVVGVVLSFSCFPPAAYGESDVPPDRTLLIPTYLLVLSVVLVGISIGNSLSRHPDVLLPMANVALALLLIGAALSISQMLSNQQPYIAYANAWGRFHAEMIAVRRAGIPHASISTIDMKSNNWAELNVLGDNPKFWLNKCVSAYYGVSVISSTP